MVGNNNTSSTVATDAQGSNDPLFVHHSDSPSMVLVTPPLAGDNYSSWIRAMTMALRAKNKIGFVDGTLKGPIINPVARTQWERCNDLVSSWILNSVSVDIRTSILYAETAREIWLDLEERFAQSNAPLIYSIQQTIVETTQEDKSVSSYFTKLKSSWNELSTIVTAPPCTCGHGKAIADQIQQERAMKFLQGLNDRFAALRSQILIMDPFPPITKIYSLVRQEEKQQEIQVISNSNVDAAALAAKPFYQKNTFNKSNSFNRKPRYHCDHCGRDGHTKDRCFSLHGYPPKKIDAPPKDNNAMNVTSPVFTQDQYNKVLAMLASGSVDSHANLAGPINEEDDWTG